MKLIGQYAPATRSQSLIGWLGVIVAVALLLPWIALAIGCVLAGVVAIQRGERSLFVCLPAGVALLVLPALLCWLNYRWYPRIQGFILDGNEFSYTLARDSTVVHRSLDEVRWVQNRGRRRRSRGYLLKFQDGSGIYVSRALSNADELAGLLSNVLRERHASCWTVA